MKKTLSYAKFVFVVAALFVAGLYTVSTASAQLAIDGTATNDHTLLPPPGNPVGGNGSADVPTNPNLGHGTRARVVTGATGTRETTSVHGTTDSSDGTVNTPPVITLLGDNPMTVFVGETFTDPGATAFDSEDLNHDLTSQIVILLTPGNGNVDTSRVGTYFRTYYVSDSQGASDTKIRTINVILDPRLGHANGATGNTNGTATTDTTVDNGNGGNGGHGGGHGNGGSTGGGSTSSSGGSGFGSGRNSSGNTGTGLVLGAQDFKFLTDLRVGMRNNDVMELQKRLRTEGFFFYPENTGYFGPFTRLAVMLYQYTHYADIGYITGFFGPLTRAVINR